MPFLQQHSTYVGVDDSLSHLFPSCIYLCCCRVGLLVLLLSLLRYGVPYCGPEVRFDVAVRA